MLFDDNNISLDLSLFNLPGINESKMNSNNYNNNSKNKFLSAKEGFLKGNSFKDEYKPYKNLRNGSQKRIYEILWPSYGK